MMNKFRRILKTFISLMIICSMCMSMCVFAAKDEEPWDSEYKHGSTLMPFTPADGYISQQNPPSFKWGYVEGANMYDLVIAADAEPPVASMGSTTKTSLLSISAGSLQ